METALGLALVTLVAMVLSAGVVGLLFKVAESERRVDLAQHTARSLSIQLQVEARLPEPDFGRVLRPYAKNTPEGGALWFVDKNYQPLAVVVGEPAAAMDQGSRAALYSKQESLEVSGSRLGRRQIHITEPVLNGPIVVGALRFTAKLDAKGPFGGDWRALLLYILCSTGVIAGFGFLLFRRRLVRPILQIQEATDLIAGGAFGQQVEVDGPRELMELSSALSSMSSSLERFRSQSEEQVASLEEANRELKEVQQELIDSEKLASVGRLAAGIAHEVGNPLAAVMGYVELLQEGLKDPEMEKDIVHRCRVELERIRQIISDLLDYSRPEALSFAPESVDALLEEAMARVRVLPQFQGIQMEVRLEEDLPQVQIQRSKVHQVLLNLLMNAADAMQGKGVISLEASASDGGVSIRCLDSGPGFEEENLGRLFDPFFSTKEPGAGTGLGLAVSLSIAKSQSGTLRAGNREEGGAWVCLELPVVGA
jgi:signal transduction histidine kinase